jgi:hypothetical protein
MALFGRKKPAAPKRTFDQTMQLVQAAMDEDHQAVLRLCQEVQPIDIFADLGDFYAKVAPALKPEQKDVMRKEIDAADGPPEVKNAVHDIGNPLFIDNDPHAVSAQINKHGKALINHPEGLWAGVTMETVFAAARINKDLNIQMNWS